MLGWSMTFSVADTQVTFGAVDESGRKILSPLAKILSLPLNWGEFGENGSLVIREGMSLETRRETVFDWQWRGGARFFATDWSGPMILEIDPDRFPVLEPPILWLRFLLDAGLFPLRRSGKGVVHHGALIQRENFGILLAGPSGIGKSTLCSDVAPLWDVLADDMVLCYRNGDRLCARPLPTWSLWTAPGKRPRPFHPSREVTLDLAIILGRGDSMWRRLSLSETKRALSASFGYFVPQWRLGREIHFLRRELVDGLGSVLDDFSENLPGYYFCRNREDDPLAPIEAMVNERVS